jgi:hypothetical protein
MKLVLLILAILTLTIAGSARATSDPTTGTEDGGQLIVEIGEGIPQSIPHKVLREQVAAYKRSAVGRKWLKTKKGKEYAADVERVLSLPPWYTQETPKTVVKTFTVEGPDYLDECGNMYDPVCFNEPDAWYELDDLGGADSYSYFGGCKNPYVFVKYKNRFGYVLWKYNQQVNFCWNGGTITYTFRSRWVYVNPIWLNGWGFIGHVNSNCDGGCYGWWVGWSWATFWTQGKFEICSLPFHIGCRSRYPLVGLNINGWGGWSGGFQ